MLINEINFSQNWARTRCRTPTP